MNWSLFFIVGTRGCVARRDMNNLDLLGFSFKNMHIPISIETIQLFSILDLQQYRPSIESIEDHKEDRLD